MSAYFNIVFCFLSLETIDLCSRQAYVRFLLQLEKHYNFYIKTLEITVEALQVMCQYSNNISATSKIILRPPRETEMRVNCVLLACISSPYENSVCVAACMLI